MLILASNSPRRREILSEFGYCFSVVKSDFVEYDAFFDPIKTVLQFSKGKAESVFNKGLGDKIVLGADTVVYFDGKILGKPKNHLEAEKTLKMLSGKMHKVFTGYAVLSDKIKVYGVDCSEVKFNLLSDDLINDYVKSGKPLDKAGSYGIQDGFPLVESVKGSIYNVIGLPIEKLKLVLDELLNKIGT